MPWQKISSMKLISCSTSCISFDMDLYPKKVKVTVFDVRIA